LKGAIMTQISAVTKKCSNCCRAKLLSAFSKKGPTRLQSWCKECSRAKSRRHYIAHKTQYVQRARARKQNCRQWFRAYKSQLKCSRCSETHPACLQFHHADPTLKEFSVGPSALTGLSLARIQQEIAKCIVLCANCHLKEHWHED
jgi:hypothetical protein